MPLPEYKPRPLSERDEMLMVAHRVGSIHDIPDWYRVVDHHVGFLEHYVRHVHDIESGQTALSLGRMIADRLSHDQTIVINNGSHGEVVGISRTEEGHRVTRIKRFGEGGEEIVHFRVPQYSIGFSRQEAGLEFLLQIQEEDDPDKRIQVSSNGNLRPRPFIVATDKEIIFARGGKGGSLACWDEYMGPTAWYISGVKNLPRSHHAQP